MIIPEFYPPAHSHLDPTQGVSFPPCKTPSRLATDPRFVPAPAPTPAPGLALGARGLPTRPTGTWSGLRPDESTRARTLVRELERDEPEREDEDDMRRWRCMLRGSTPGTFAARAKSARTGAACVSERVWNTKELVGG